MATDSNTRSESTEQGFTSADVLEMLADYEWRECEVCHGTGVDDLSGKACPPCDNNGVIRVRVGEV
jgi:DnaJ-class molecular chaperone